MRYNTFLKIFLKFYQSSIRSDYFAFSLRLLIFFFAFLIDIHPLHNILRMFLICFLESNFFNRIFKTIKSNWWGGTNKWWIKSGIHPFISTWRKHQKLHPTFNCSCIPWPFKCIFIIQNILVYKFQNFFCTVLFCFSFFTFDWIFWISRI